MKSVQQWSLWIFVNFAGTNFIDSAPLELHSQYEISGPNCKDSNNDTKLLSALYFGTIHSIFIVSLLVNYITNKNISLKIGERY